MIECRWSTRNLWHTERINIELRCLEEAWNFQCFLYSQSGLHRWLTWRLVKVIELQNANHLLSLCSYFSPCNLISHHSLFLFRWFTTVDSLSLQRVAMTKLKTWTQQKRSLKGKNLRLVNLFCRHWMVFKGVLLWWAILEICKSMLLQNKLGTAMVKNCFIQNNFNRNAQLLFTWTGNQFYQKYFVVVS